MYESQPDAKGEAAMLQLLKILRAGLSLTGHHGAAAAGLTTFRGEGVLCGFGLLYEICTGTIVQQVLPSDKRDLTASALVRLFPKNELLKPSLLNSCLRVVVANPRACATPGALPDLKILRDAFKAEMAAKKKTQGFLKSKGKQVLHNDGPIHRLLKVRIVWE